MCTQSAQGSQHGRHIEGLERQSLPAGATVGGRVNCVRSGGVVMLEQRDALHEGSPDGADASPSGVEVGAAVDAVPRLFSLIQRLGMRGHRDNAETGLRVAVGRHSCSVNGIAVALAHCLRGKVASQKTWSCPSGT